MSEPSLAANFLPALPVLLPLAVACVALLLRHHHAVALVTCIVGSIIHVALGVLLVIRADALDVLILQVGQWPAPFGITILIDRLGAAMVLLSGVMALLTTLYLAGELPRADRPKPFLPLVQLLLMGVCGAFTTGDLFNLYVWFEVLLLSSFVLMGLGGHRQNPDAAIKYVLLNLLSSTFFLIAAGLIYATLGTLNYADLARVMDGTSLREGSAIGPAAVLLLVAFAIKAAAFPFAFWLPASYHTPRFAVAALFAALLTKVGLFAILRVYTLPFSLQDPLLQPLLVALAGLSMVLGVFGAATQQDLRRILSFHSVSQMGYVLMGLSIGTHAALAAAIVFILHHAIVKSGLFLVAGNARVATGAEDLRDPRLAGLATAAPLHAALFLVLALSLAGIPPLSGFFGKLALVAAGLSASAWTLVAIALAVSILTTYSMLKIWAGAFWAPRDASYPAIARVPASMTAATLALAVAAVGMGLFAGPVMGYAERAATTLRDPASLIARVLPQTTATSAPVTPSHPTPALPTPAPHAEPAATSPDGTQPAPVPATP